MDGGLAETTSPPDPAPGQHRHASAPRSVSDLITLPAIFVIGLTVIFLRSPSTILKPELWAEDGVFWFPDAYAHGWFAPLKVAHTGYLQTFPRLIAGVGLAIPLGDVPRMFALVALVVQVLPALLIVSRRYSRLIPDIRVRLLLAAVYLVIPNSSEVNVNLTNAQWHLGLLAVMIVLAAPARGGWRIFDIVFVALSGLTGPFVLSLLVVVVVLYVITRRRWTLVLGSVAAICGIVQAFELFTSPRGQYGPLGVTVDRFVEILGGRLIANTVLGRSITTSHSFMSHLMAWSLAFLVVGALVVGAAVWRGPLELKLFNLYAGLVLAGTLASPVATIHGEQWQALIVAPGARYWLIPSLAILADTVWLAGRIHGRARVGAVLAVVLLLVVGAFGVRTDFHYPNTLVKAWGPQVQRFDRLPAHTAFTFEIRPAGWVMTLVKK